jgi:hypothetical protein
MKIRALTLMLSLVAVPAFAQPTKQPVSTAEFQALAAQVAALQAQVATLTTDATNPAGTWVIMSRGLALKNNPPRIGEEAFATTLVLQNDGTGTITLTGSDTELTLSVPAIFEREAGTFSAPITWTFDGTHLIMTIADGDQLGATVAAGGRALLTGITSPNGPDGSWSDIWIGIKLPPQ